MHKDCTRLLAEQDDGQIVCSWLEGNGARPLRQIAREPLQRWVREHQDTLARNLHANTIVDEGRKTRGALPPEYLGKPLGIGPQGLGAGILDSYIVGIPQRRGEQDQGSNTERDVAERQSER